MHPIVLGVDTVPVHERSRLAMRRPLEQRPRVRHRKRDTDPFLQIASFLLRNPNESRRRGAMLRLDSDNRGLATSTSCPQLQTASSSKAE